MFPWNIAKSAEAMFSRWALKRVCKFLLKKKLGRFILGEIDLDQLDIQLGQGIIQLNDLALNVDYINQKLGAAASLRLKEGSISALLVKLPWTAQGCQVEVDGLEIIICPCGENNSKAQEGVSRCSDDNKKHRSKSSTQLEHVILDSVEKSTPVDVHEGVKTIAKMVKWLLTSFHVKIRNLILAFDPNLGEEEKKTECLSTLVLRTSQIECGTCISEDADTSADILGISRLINFVKFQGAVIELLKIEGNSQEQNLYESGYMHGEPFPEHFPGKATSLIMSGIGDALCGNLKVSIPWKNGSLDVGKIDADASIDQMVLRFQPSTIKWILKTLKTYNNQKNCKVCVHDKSAEAVCLDSTFFNSSSKGCANEEISVSSSPQSISSMVVPESAPQVLFPESNLISDWLRFSIKRDVITETDFGESVDQFFECIDGMRSFHSALGSSAMWNWTCSVYSAITAASTLASGSSLQIPSEQQHVETNLRVNIYGISILFAFHDEEQNPIAGPQIDKCHDLNVNYLGVECRDINLDMQVCSHAVTVEGKVKYMEVARFFCDEGETLACGTLENSTNLNSQTVLIQKLQTEVLDALPASASYVMDPDSDLLTRLVAVQLPSRYKVGLVKAVLLTTSGVTQGKFMAESNSLDGSFTGPMSFSLNLSSFIFWLDFLVIDMIISLLEGFRESGRVRDQKDESSSKPSRKKNESSHSDSQEGSGPRLTTLRSGGNFHGDILISNARVILCFPFGKDINCRNLFWNEFIALDFSLPSTSNGNVSSKGEGLKRCSSTVTRSFHLRFCDLKMYLISCSSNESGSMSSYNMQRDRFSAQCFLFVHSKACYNSVLSMLWQEGLVTGPWIAKRAKLLATSEESIGRHNFAGKDYEFASATTIQDLDHLKNQIQQDIILSSTFFIHIDLSAIVLNLTPSQYGNLHHLFTQMLTSLSQVTSHPVDVPSESLVSQTSILMESESLEISIGLDKMDDIRRSLQSELPGFWSRMKLEILKFELLSVTNIGGVKGADFFHLMHSEGKLWGSVSACNQNFQLITCSNSTMKRGDGYGSNVLSQRGAGSSIAHLWFPETSQSFTSATVSCGTIVAVGGRLDWFDSILSFFILPSKGIDEPFDNGITKGEQKAPPTSSFILNLIDIGLSYEPHIKNPQNHTHVLDTVSNFTYINEERTEHVGCLLAASSLVLSCSSVGGSSGNDYKIKLHDLGLLLHVVKEPGAYSGNYCVEQLQKAGYVKIAQESLVEATLRTNCGSGLRWEVELSRSHIVLETCHDTTASLIHLAAQIQQLFAPDVEESIVHLQTRWDNVQEANKMDDLTDEDGTSSCDTAALTSAACSSNENVKGEHMAIGLMDMICEDAFHLDKDRMGQSKFSTSGLYPPHEINSGVKASKGGIEEPEIFPDDILHNDNEPRIGLETSEASFLENDYFPEFIEGYFLSDLRPLSESSVGLQSKEPCKYVPKDGRRCVVGKAGGGWYEDTSIKFLENHIRETYEPNGAEHFDNSSNNGSTVDGNEKVCGRLVLNHVDITWKMYGGADWHDSGELGQHSANVCGRNTNALLELALNGLKFHYDLFPVGGVRVSRMSLSVRDLHLFDLSRDAPWKLVLGYYHSRDHPRESSSKAFKLELEAVRPDPQIPLEEYRSRVAFLPIVLHLHQCQLDFVVSFFGATSSSNIQSCRNDEVPESSKSLPDKSKNLAGHVVANEALLPYFQKFDIWPIIIRVDYSPSHVDLAALRRGKYVELMNLVPWKGVELHLKHVEAAGIYGWSSVCETVMGEWLEDISQNQIHKIFQGLPPVRSLIAVGSGASKLVSSPVHNYKKDQRVLKGMQRGSLAFVRSISLEAVGLGVHLAAGAHDILLQAEYLLTGVPSSVPRAIKDKSKRDVHSNQPRDAQQGIQKACESFGHGLSKSASVLVQNPLKKYQRGSGAGPAFAAAVKAVPAAAIAPASACASAVHYALLGFRNSLDPERKKESIEKYSPTQPWEQK